MSRLTRDIINWAKGDHDDQFQVTWPLRDRILDFVCSDNFEEVEIAESLFDFIENSNLTRIGPIFELPRDPENTNLVHPCFSGPALLKKLCRGDKRDFSGPKSLCLVQSIISFLIAHWCAELRAEENVLRDSGVESTYRFFLRRTQDTSPEISIWPSGFYIPHYEDPWTPCLTAYLSPDGYWRQVGPERYGVAEIIREKIIRNIYTGQSTLQLEDWDF